MSSIYPPPKGLSREFVLKSILHILDTAAETKGWGSVTISFQSGILKTIRKEETITEEK
jgi:hypothetical protein